MYHLAHDGTRHLQDNAHIDCEKSLEQANMTFSAVALPLLTCEISETNSYQCQ